MTRNSKRSNRVCAFGTFDVLHLGHLRYLEAAKLAGGADSELFVVVARDKSVITIKGKAPIFPEQHRVALVSGLKPVTKAVLGNEDSDYFKIIEELQPQILAIGYDQWVDLDQLREALETRFVKNIQIIRLAKSEDELGSSTLIKKRIAARFNQLNKEGIE